LIDGWIPSVDHGTFGDGGLAQKPWMLNVKLWGGWMSNYLAESKIAHSAWKSTSSIAVHHWSPSCGRRFWGEMMTIQKLLGYQAQAGGISRSFG